MLLFLIDAASGLAFLFPWIRLMWQKDTLETKNASRSANLSSILREANDYNPKKAFRTDIDRLSYRTLFNVV